MVARIPAALARTFPTELDKQAKSFGNLQLPCSIRAWIKVGVLGGWRCSNLLRLEQRAVTGDGKHTSVEQQEPQTGTLLCKEIQCGLGEMSSFIKQHSFPPFWSGMRRDADLRMLLSVPYCWNRTMNGSRWPLSDLLLSTAFTTTVKKTISTFTLIWEVGRSKK